MAQGFMQHQTKKNLSVRATLLCFFASIALLCTACSGGSNSPQTQTSGDEADMSNYLVAIEDEPDTVDFQCTSIHYTIATNVFDRLVEMESDKDGNVLIEPSLAEHWEESKDGTTYSFKLREGVKFSNGSPLTSSDVLYSFTRLLTHPDSCNADIIDGIKGASRLANKEADSLEGFKIVDDLNFTITLEKPFEAFLACLSMPGASIMDEETTTASEKEFGKDSAATIGTGSYVLKEWTPGKEMILTANESCWRGLPKNKGLQLLFVAGPEEIRGLFEDGKLDILDLDDLGSSSEYYVHGDIYKDKLREVPQIGISYIALNESIKPLTDARVRQALQLSLDRDMLLNVVDSGLGSVENGIFSRGLYGFNPDLPAIPFDVARAKELLKEAGYENGFDLTFSVKSSSTQREMELANNCKTMWKEVGVNLDIKLLDESEFMKLRKSGELACYTATWTADYNDPDNYIYTFFGSSQNTINRSLCYPREDVIDRVQKARTITDPKARLQEYWNLEQTIAQDDAAWIPLFSRTRLYVVSDRVEDFQHAWNGSVKNVYRDIVIKTTS